MNLHTLWVAFLAGSALGASTAELAPGTFFGAPQYRSVSLSPDANYLAVLARNTSTGKYGVYVVDLKDNHATWVLTQAVAPPAWMNWLGTNRLLIQCTRTLGAGLMTVNRDGSGAHEVIPRSFSSTEFFRILPGNSDEILVTSYEHSTKVSDSLLRYPNIEKLNLTTGALVMDTKNPGHVVVWETDNDGVVRIGIERVQTKLTILYRPDAKAPWERLLEYEFKVAGDIAWPHGFLSDNRTLVIESRAGNNTLGLYRYDLPNRRLGDALFHQDSADILNYVYSSSSGAIVGAAYEAGRRQFLWIDPAYKRLQESIDSVLTNSVNRLVSGGPVDGKAVFLATSDRDPGTYYLVNTSSLTIQKLFQAAPWIPIDHMSEMKPIEYHSRDGLLINGFLTLPVDHPPRKLPLVVKVRDSPFGIESWGFDSQTQFFANRGYAVLQINFRGSLGRGLQFQAAGFHEMGLKQQDDITDGVKWAISEGIADPARVAIFGSEYGGFAALTGLEQTPDLYRCGICESGYLDILEAFKPAKYQLDLKTALQNELIGDRHREKSKLKQISPTEHLDQIQAPVLLAYVENGGATPIETVKKVADQLKKRGKLHELILLKQDDPSASRLEFWNKVDAFLKANLR